MIVLKESPICERIGPAGEKMNITTRNLEQGGEAEMPKISADPYICGSGSGKFVQIYKVLNLFIFYYLAD